jgi:hypothetical protein
MFLQIFREPKRSGMVDDMLNEYATHIARPGSSGAIMFSVVGEFTSEYQQHLRAEMR